MLPKQQEFSNEQWKSILGTLWFGLSRDGDDAGSFRPTFRSLFSFVARRQEGGGFQFPMQHSTMQQIWDRQVVISYLIGLDWMIPGRFQKLRDEERIARELRRAAESDQLGRYVGNVAELHTRLAVAEDRADRLRERIEGFHVVPEYKELELEASEITMRVNDLNVENVVDQDLIRELRASLDTAWEF